MKWWADNLQEDCPGEFCRINVVLYTQMDTTIICFLVVIVADKVVQDAPIARARSE